MDLEEFKVLVKNLVPTTDEQSEWICEEVERLTREHPELKRKIEEWSKMPESERRELKEIIGHMLARWRGRENAGLG